MDLATAIATIESRNPEAVYMIRRGDGDWAVHVKTDRDHFEIGRDHSLFAAVKSVAAELEAYDSDIASLV